MYGLEIAALPQEPNIQAHSQESPVLSYTRIRRRGSRPLEWAAGVSLVLFVGLLFGWAFARWYVYGGQRASDPSVGVTGIMRIGIGGSGFGEIWLTNRDKPYRRSIIASANGQGRTSPPTRIVGWNTPFYFRHIRQPGTTWWTAILPIPLLLLLAALPPAIWLMRRHRGEQGPSRGL